MGEWSLKIDFPVIIVLISAAAALILQLLLCFKAKKLLLKLIPVALFIVSAIIFSVCSAAVNGWDGIGYLFFALLSFGLIFVCGIGWGVWAVVRKRS